MKLWLLVRDETLLVICLVSHTGLLNAGEKTDADKRKRPSKAAAHALTEQERKEVIRLGRPHNFLTCLFIRLSSRWPIWASILPLRAFFLS